MSTKSKLMDFTIVAALALISTMTVAGSLVNAQPALAKISSSEEDIPYQEEETVTTSQLDEVSSMLKVVGDKEEEESDEDAKEIHDDYSDKASSTNYEDEQDHQCRKGNVLKGVYDPGRLNVLSSCEEAVGIVHDSERVNDGDFKFYLDVEDEYKKLLNEANDKRANGLLVVEIIPKDQGSSMIEIPEDGDRVRVVGAWVSDEGAGGWNEIHPTWKVEVLG
jgi:hypothetical protein